ncbi:uncharacterized protein LOC105172510 isoform X2 [Sesamum indicum]|uniref:Uncharacterized protein LOC105172510 isoform X2 n=1 Tax=Sesamum indicum TaxID=4182 RepID=A0A6I9TY38_SESIN|nr:uncharacterized protein LOC105172510 isoform X2 [Sesamum indicum]
MKSYNCGFPLSDPKSRSCLCSLFITVSLICGVYFIGSAWLRKDLFKLSPGFGLNTTQRHRDSDRCKGKCRPIGTEALPEGIITKSSNLEMRPLCGPVPEDKKSKNAMGLLAISAGINQKRLVNEIVKKFLGNDFAVMLFHYDGVVDKWHDLEWSNRVIHVSAINQTKWWFAKRFLHPDIVAEYDYIFLWDEDLGVENFHPGRYLSIIKEEGLEISQPALDPRKSEVHHPITMRRWRSRVHRRFYKFKGGGRCDDNSTSPPCVGWVEMMAPVFSRAAWRCAWYMIQNDLIHAWGLDMKLGYCAQGDRMVKVGVVDEEYIVHLGLPTLGGYPDKNKTNDQRPRAKNLSDSEPLAADMYRYDNRSAVRRQSYNEMMTFRKRWNNAVEEDECWIDPFKQGTTQG